ncbi:MAG: two-component sensor histidine kinase [Gemmatimonadetes bacterium]|nr:two-component sensor histidine kinase [Gemmatimonadota bacterium]
MTLDDLPTHRGRERDVDSLISQGRYRRLRLVALTAVSVVAVVPLLIMAGVNYYQYRQAFRAELGQPMVSLVTSGKQGLESFLDERMSALQLLVRERTYGDLRDPAHLGRVLVNMKQAFGGFVDLGVLDDKGVQVTYAGPFELAGRSYESAPWYHEVTKHGSYVSDVFTGYRNAPHIVVAVEHDTDSGHFFVLRATIDTELINRLVASLATRPSSDAFLVDQARVLQTPSRIYGAALEQAQLPPLGPGGQPQLTQLTDGRGVDLMVSYARIEHSPFTLVLVSPQGELLAGWLALRRNLLVFLGVSVVLILAVVSVGTTYMVNRYREADMLRAAAYHKMEYTNKMAALGRLSAGVAHEINNPLSIITEKAGLLKDLLLMAKETPPKDRVLELVDSVLRSADRCGNITHRLLGFAKHMEVRSEAIDLDGLLVEVLGFLEKEATYRNITVDFAFPDAPPRIVSDRGQLQQVFLNIINNAFAAVDDHGRIEIGIRDTGSDAVAVWIADDGVGIAEEHLPHIFDPFFTTKKGAGTGLGLSITYGIVQKLGGDIAVQSKVGEGTRFTVTLPRGSTDV